MSRNSFHQATSGGVRRPQLCVESLEERNMLSADGLGLASIMPELPMQLNEVIMQQLQEHTAEHGVTSADLLQIPALRNPLDVNVDGFISPIDPLMVIHQLNRGGVRNVSGEGEPNPHDVNGDSVVSSRDALQVIHAVNSGQYTNRPWWDVGGSVREVISDSLEHVQEILTQRGLDDVAERIGQLQQRITEHIAEVEEAVGERLERQDHQDELDNLLTAIDNTRQTIHEHLTRLQERIHSHLDYVEGEFYGELASSHAGYLTRAQVDDLLDGQLSVKTQSTDTDHDDSASWHRDYVRDLIDRHIEYVREGLDIDQIDELIGTHVDYITELFEIHDLPTPDLSHVGDVLAHVHHIQDWLEDLAEGEHTRLPERVPDSVQDHLDAVADHVGFIQELVDKHLEILRGDWERWQEDWASLVDSHLDFVNDLLADHRA